MPEFPLFVSLEGKRCAVFGGGAVALRKINTLIQFGADIYVYSKQFESEICLLAKNVPDTGSRVILMDFSGKDISAALEGAFLAICATSDISLNDRIARLCHEQGIWVNNAAGAQASSFIFPAVTVRGDICAGVSTGGQAPSLAAHIRQQIGEVMPAWYGSLGKRLAQIRGMLKRSVENVSDRRVLMGVFTEYGLEHHGHIPDGFVCDSVNKYLSEKEMEHYD